MKNAVFHVENELEINMHKMYTMTSIYVHFSFSRVAFYFSYRSQNA